MFWTAAEKLLQNLFFLYYQKPMKLDAFDIWTVSNENNLVAYLKNRDVFKKFDDIIIH